MNIIINIERATLISNIKRVYRIKEIRKNEIKEPLNLKKDYSAYLKLAHKRRISDLEEKFIFDNSELFKKVCEILSEINGQIFSEYAFNHENEHVGKALKYNMDFFYGITFDDMIYSQNGSIKQMSFKYTPEAIIFIEKYALDNNLPINEFFRITKDILNVSQPSPGDLDMLHKIDEIENKNLISAFGSLG